MMSVVIMLASIAFAFGLRANNLSTHLASILSQSMLAEARYGAQPKAAAMHSQTTFPTVLTDLIYFELTLQQ